MSKYELLETVGEGTNVVRRAKVKAGARAGENVAIKIIPKKGVHEMLLDRLRQEFEIHRGLDHPNVVKMHEHFEDCDYFYMVTELAEGGDLFSFLEKSAEVSEASIRTLMQQLLQAVAYLHANKIVHRDIKMDNMVLSNKPGDGPLTVKVIDFGVSKNLSQSNSCTIVGTRPYLAPEIALVEAGKADNYDNACDLWSCGVVMYALASHRFPFGDGVPITESTRYDTKLLRQLSPAALHLLAQLLTWNPKQRITALQALDHPFFYPERPFPPVVLRAICDHSPEPEEGDFLGFKAGDLITQLEVRESGWLLGRTAENKGLFPASYTEPAPVDDHSASSASTVPESPATEEAQQSTCLLS